MLKQISCPSITTLVRCVVQPDGWLEVFDPDFWDFVALVTSSDSELELELELELEVELEADSELELDSDDDEEEEDEDDDDDDDEEEEEEEDSDDDDEDEDESSVELSSSNPLALAFFGLFCPITSTRWTSSFTHGSSSLRSFSFLVCPLQDSSMTA